MEIFIMKIKMARHGYFGQIPFRIIPSKLEKSGYFSNNSLLIYDYVFSHLIDVVKILVKLNFASYFCWLMALISFNLNEY